MIISDVDTGCVLMVISGIKVSWTMELSSLEGEIYSFHINRFSGTNRTVLYSLFHLKRFLGTKHGSSNSEIILTCFSKHDYTLSTDCGMGKVFSTVMAD